MAFLNKTIKGGILFVLPFALTLILAEKAFRVLNPLATVISEKIDPQDKVRFDLAYLIALILLLLICFLCGLFAASRAGKSVIAWLENNVLALFPGYEMLKSHLQSAVGLDPEKNFPVVLAPVDGWMIAFVIETLPDETHVVFVPGSPSPWSGNVMMFAPSELKTTTLSQKEALAILRHTGIGMKDRIFQVGPQISN